MKIPKYIEKLIDRRASYADEITSIDIKLDRWLYENGIEVEEYDICGGAEEYVNPWDSAQRIKEAIERVGEHK